VQSTKLTVYRTVGLAVLRGKMRMMRKMGIKWTKWAKGVGQEAYFGG
jgi:hypothetical protein